MASDPDEALRWEGDDDAAPALPRGWKAVGRGSERAGRPSVAGDPAPTTGETAPEDEAARAQPLSTAMLLLVGVMGGIYLLYTVGWVIGGFTLQAGASFLIPVVMYQAALWAAVLAPALWFLVVWLLTRGAASWIRVLGLVGGAVLLVPWPFVMTGAVGA